MNQGKSKLHAVLSWVLTGAIAFSPQISLAQRSTDGGTGSNSSFLDYLALYESMEIPLGILNELTTVFGPTKKVTNNKSSSALSDIRSGKKPSLKIDLRGLDPEKAAQTWRTFISSFSLSDTVISPPKDEYRTSLGYFLVEKRRPSPTISETSHPRLRVGSAGGALGFRITYEFETASEIFSECQFREEENGGLTVDRIENKIKTESQSRNYCSVANALRALQLKDLARFKQKNGYTALLHGLADGGYLLDFNREAESYLRFENPSWQALEQIRFYQLEGYASLIPGRHVNPRGTAAGNNFASEFVALIELFKASYPNSRFMPQVREIENRLFTSYISEYSIPVASLLIPIRDRSTEDKMLIYKQTALTPRKLSDSYPNITWSADPLTLEKILAGKESIVETTCGCFVQENEKQEPKEVAEVRGLGFSKLGSSDKALDTCIRVAQAASKTREGYAFTHQCTHRPVDLTSDLKASVEQEMKSAIAREELLKSAYKKRPNYLQKLLVASLALTMGAVTWRCRGGGGCPALGTQTARLFYAVIPQTLFGGVFGYLEDGWGGVRDGAITGALMTPSLFIPWGRQMDVGRAGGSKWEDFSLLMIRGYAQTLPAAWYAASVGKDPSPILVAGVAMAPTYFAAWQWGDRVNVNAFFDGPTGMAEFGWGGILTGFGLLKTVAPSWSPY